MSLHASAVTPQFEVRRLANLPEYRNLPQCVKLVQEVADKLNLKSPLHPD